MSKKYSFMSKNLTKSSEKILVLKLSYFSKLRQTNDFCKTKPSFFFENKLKELSFMFKSLCARSFQIKLIKDFHKISTYFIRFENSKFLVLRSISENFHKSPYGVAEDLGFKKM